MTSNVSKFYQNGNGRSQKTLCFCSFVVVDLFGPCGSSQEIMRCISYILL